MATVVYRCASPTQFDVLAKFGVHCILSGHRLLSFSFDSASCQCLLSAFSCCQQDSFSRNRGVTVCAQAEQRQQKFDQSAGGRAARKAVAEVVRDRQAGRPDNDQMAKDWVN